MMQAANLRRALAINAMQRASAAAKGRQHLLPIFDDAATALRAVLAALEGEEASNPTPTPARVYAPGLLRVTRRRRPVHHVPQTVPGDFRPTVYGPPSSVARTEPMTLMEPRA